jgi:probable HAF family extracellular repeat protein
MTHAPPNRRLRRLGALTLTAGALLTAAPAPAQVLYTLTDMGVPPGTYDRTFAGSVNDSGQAAGYSDLSTGAQTLGWRYTPGAGFQPLGLPPGATSGYSNPYAINNAGQVVGDVSTGGSLFGFRWTEGAGMATLPTLPGATSSHANAINALGQVAGSSRTSGTQLEHVARWSAAGTIEDLGLPAGRVSGAGRAINGAGQVAVTAVDSLGQARGYLYTDGAGYRDLGSLGGAAVQALGVNDAGQVVGSSALPGGSPNVTHAFVWSAAGGMQDLGALPGGSYAQAYAVNALGVIVGESEVASAPFHAFVYSRGAMRDLNGLIAPSPGWTLEVATAVSDTGLIVGWGHLNGQQRSFLLTPVPEPSSLALATAALATAWAARGRVRRTRAV